MDTNPTFSPAAKLGIGGGAGATLLGAGYFFGKGGKTFWIFLLIAVALLLLLLGGYFLWVYLKRKRQSAKLSGELHQHSSASPRGISDPGQRARLDDLRKKFDEGVAAYRSRGKDLYSLPWYVIVGEPGSGKTEAVRHSNVGFPPGMQDEFQGVGGTINMNWWFTNNAVLLDTAGRLMFEEVKPGETSEWKEFLNLLKKFRPSCPINGLILVIPVESLIKNTADEIQKKAGKIAQQLDVIQRTLDVRFPVFVVITKCDLVLGFREFFDGLTDPQLQHQMMGWSNPDPLDAPFRADLVDQHIATVVQRLTRRRLGLLRDPVPEADKQEARRIDEVDTLYALPHSLQAIVPRLRRYLETIFIAGEWSAKPLFLRGIYFSSSMREGSALDQDLAEAMGVPVDAISDFKVWERDRSYFLRDLFLEKVFRERGLVTGATNTKGMLRKRKILLYTCGFAALAVFILVAFFGMRNLKQSVKTQSDYWRAVADIGWDDRSVAKKGLVRRDDKGIYIPELNTAKIELPNGEKVSFGEFHARLRNVATTKLKSNWRYPGLATEYNEKSLKAHRIAFETSVVKPLVEAVRQKLRTELPLQGDAARRQSEALAALIQLEADILNRAGPTNTGMIDAAGVKTFTTPLLAYLTGAATTLDTNLVAVWSWLYSESEAGKSTEAGRRDWPMVWLSGSLSATNTLANHPALAAGLNNFIRSVTNNVTSQRGDWNQIVELQNRLLAYEQLEKALLTDIRLNNALSFDNHLKELLGKKKELQQWIEDARARSPLFANGVDFTNAYAVFSQGLLSSTAGALDRIKQANDRAQLQHPAAPLFRDIQGRLAEVAQGINSEVRQLVPEAGLAEMRRLQADFLTRSGQSYAFAARCDLYENAAQLMQRGVTGGAWRAGMKGKPLQDFLLGEFEPTRKLCDGYAGGARDTFTNVVNFLLFRAQTAKAGEYFATYIKQAGAELAKVVGFPLVRDHTRMLTPANIGECADFVKLVTDDLRSPVFQTYNPSPSADWLKLNTNIANLTAVRAALLGQDNVPGRVNVILMGMLTSSAAGKDAWRAPLRKIRLESAAKREDTNTLEDTPLGAVGLNDPLSLSLTDQFEPPREQAQGQKTEDWGPLRLALAGGREDKADKRVWTVDWAFKDPKYASMGDVRLKLQFERPLPDLASWPSLQQF
ncbi:MAG: hypothetical protein HZA90_24235 [Verrucomicrobia bacterium]|nr:hypothetical protein [Verrucomicrobiota bacterium]